MKKLIFIFCFNLLLLSCLKYDDDKNQVLYKPPKSCNEFNNLKIKSIDTFTINDQIILKADSFDGAKYEWSGPFLSSIRLDENKINVTDLAAKFHIGWYHVYITFNSCNLIHDSIYVNVKLKQGTPNCTPLNNSASYSNSIVTIPTKNFTSINLDSNSSFFISARTFNGGGDMTFFFNEYWKGKKLEPGIYFTTSNQSLSDKESINKVFIEDRNLNLRWIVEENKPVYVSYINGKLTLTGCNLKFIESNNLSANINFKISVP